MAFVCRWKASETVSTISPSQNGLSGGKVADRRNGLRPGNKKKCRVTCILGTRPEAIKLAPVILALREQSEIECRVWVTGQHREMLDQVLEVFEIIPDEDLNLMRENQTLSELTASAVSSLDKLMQKERPDLVLVQGDTTTVFAAALVAFYHHVPIMWRPAFAPLSEIQSFLYYDCPMECLPPIEMRSTFNRGSWSLILLRLSFCFSLFNWSSWDLYSAGAARFFYYQLWTNPCSS